MRKLGGTTDPETERRKQEAQKRLLQIEQQNQKDEERIKVSYCCCMGDGGLMRIA